MGVGSCCDHDDRDVARSSDASAEFEAVDTGEHDVDQNDVGRLAGELDHAFFTTRRLVDDPTLVLERETNRRTDPLVVFDCQDPRGHAVMLGGLVATIGLRGDEFEKRSVESR